MTELIDELSKPSPKEPLPLNLICDAIYCLIELGSVALAETKLFELKKQNSFSETEEAKLDLLMLACDMHRESLTNVIDPLIHSLHRAVGVQEVRVLLHFMERAIETKQTALVYHLASRLQGFGFDSETSTKIDSLCIWAYLQDKNWEKAGELLHRYPLEMLNQETSSLHFLYGCWLLGTEGKEIAHIHFSGVLEVSFPRSWALFSHHLIGDLENNAAWQQKAFLWEKRQLYRQLSLYNHCLGDEAKANHYAALSLKL